MAADAGLIKSASQAYRSEDPNIKLGEDLKYGFGMIATGMLKKQELDREKAKEEAIKREKLHTRMRLADKKAMDNEIEVAGRATNPEQLKLANDFASSTRLRSSILTSALETLSPTSPEYLEASQELIEIRTSMELFGKQIDFQNELMGSVSAIDFNLLAKHNSEETLEFTALAKEGDYKLTYEDGKILMDFNDGNGGLTQDEVREKLAVLPDLNIMNKFSGIAEEMAGDAAAGRKINNYDVDKDFYTLRSILNKSGPEGINSLKTMLTEDIMNGFKATDDETMDRLWQEFQNAKTDEDIINAKQNAINYLVGDGEKGPDGNTNNGFLGRSANDYYTKTLEQYKTDANGSNSVSGGGSGIQTYIPQTGDVFVDTPDLAYNELFSTVPIDAMTGKPVMTKLTDGSGTLVAKTVPYTKIDEVLEDQEAMDYLDLRLVMAAGDNGFLYERVETKDIMPSPLKVPLIEDPEKKVITIRITKPVGTVSNEIEIQNLSFSGPSGLERLKMFMISLEKSRQPNAVKGTKGGIFVNVDDPKS